MKPILIAECPRGHELTVTPWVDAQGNIRIIVQPCLQCEPKIVVHTGEMEVIDLLN